MLIRLSSQILTAAEGTNRGKLQAKQVMYKSASLAATDLHYLGRENLKGA